MRRITSRHRTLPSPPASRPANCQKQAAQPQQRATQPTARFRLDTTLKHLFSPTSSEPRCSLRRSSSSLSPAPCATPHLPPANHSRQPRHRSRHANFITAPSAPSPSFRLNALFHRPHTAAAVRWRSPRSPGLNGCGSACSGSYGTSNRMSQLTRTVNLYPPPRFRGHRSLSHSMAPQRPTPPPERDHLLALFLAQDIAHIERVTLPAPDQCPALMPLAVFRCPSLAGFRCPPRRAIPTLIDSRQCLSSGEGLERLSIDRSFSSSSISGERRV